MNWNQDELNIFRESENQLRSMENECRSTGVTQSKSGGSRMDIQRLGVGGIIFVIGAAIYIINIVIASSKRGRAIPVDGVGLMVLGIGFALLLKL
jgi:hypothetical protein